MQVLVGKRILALFCGHPIKHTASAANKYRSSRPRAEIGSSLQVVGSIIQVPLKGEEILLLSDGRTCPTVGNLFQVFVVHVASTVLRAQACGIRRM